MKWILVLSMMFAALAHAQSAAKEDDSETKFDFEEASLDGQFKAPPGLTLKGRVQQNKSQMVQLRKDFRSDLKRAPAAVRAINAKDYNNLNLY